LYAFSSFCQHFTFTLPELSGVKEAMASYRGSTNVTENQSIQAISKHD